MKKIVCVGDDVLVGKGPLAKDVVPALLRLRDQGYAFVIVSGKGKGGGKSKSKGRMESLFASQGLRFVSLHPLIEGGIDLSRSAVVGTRATDERFAENLGIQWLRFRTNWLEIARRLTVEARRAERQRKTRETNVTVLVDLDGTGESTVRTGIGFFDHMLEQLSKHSRFDIRLELDGDLVVDEHHTVEDAALTLGQALREALGDKRDVARYGFVVPMDEAEARVSIDFSGRATFVLDGVFPRESVGGLHTEMVGHFFRSLADAMAMTLHIEVRGENAHHMVESTFKAVGRALGQAAARTVGSGLPTTKGVL